MLIIRRRGNEADETWITTHVGDTVGGFNEDTDYEIKPERTGGTLFVDDVELLAASGWFRWRPAFYAGRVRVEAHHDSGGGGEYHLVVEPAAHKSTDTVFADMVAQIREFDQRLLGGTAAATLLFGNEGRVGLFPDQVLLTRLRLFGQEFLDAVAHLMRSPHLKLQAERGRLPLSQVRRLHPTALRDRKLSTLIHAPDCVVEHTNLPVLAWTSASTVDTPANRVLLALIQRFVANIRRLRSVVQALGLGGDKDEQRLRSHRRVQLLDHLEAGATRLVRQHPFCAVKSTATSSSGLTQIAAQPLYGKAYRLGCRALALAVEGENAWDQLNVSPSWGIYEAWCLIQVLAILQQHLGGRLVPLKSVAVNSALSWRAEHAPGWTLELAFQARFAAGKPSAGREGFSISRERIPDICIVERKGPVMRSLILDAKWRGGRSNVLEAMESAHIYHDSLRVGDAAPDCCLLLLPGAPDVEGLGELGYIERNRVGALSDFHPGGAGVAVLHERLMGWIDDPMWWKAL